MEGIPLKRFKRDPDDTETDLKKCIICRRAQAKHVQVLDGKEFWKQIRLKEKGLQEFTYHASNMKVTNDAPIKNHLRL